MAWRLWVRLMVYKVFARPRWEYAGALMYHASARNPDLRRHTIQPLSELQDEALAWVAGISIHQNVKTAQAVFGILSVEDRLHQLAISATRHFRYCNEENPLRQLQRKNSHRLLLKQHWLHRAITATPEYDIMMSALRPGHSAKDWLKKFAQEKMQSYSIMSQAITECARRDVGGPDALIMQPLDKAQRYLAWRLNLCFHRRNCGVCGKPFNRGHVNSCFGSAAGAQRQFEQRGGPHYNILDDYLNNQEYDCFDILYTVVDEQLTSVDRL